MPVRWLFLFLLVVLIGCGPKEVHVGGRPIGYPTKVVSLSPGTTEIVVQCGFPGQLTGRTASCNYPATLLLPNSTVGVYAGVKPDYEKLARDKPHLIVYDKSLYSDADIAKLKELNLRLYEFKANTLDQFIEELKGLGDLLGNGLSMSDYVDKIQSERDVAKANAPQKTVRVAALTGGTGNDHLIAGSRSFIADVIRNSGGEPVGPDADRFVDANPETLISLNPDVILLAVSFTATSTTQATAAVKALMDDPRFKQMSAVKNERVIPVSADVMLRRGSRVDKLIKNLGSVIQAAGR